MHIVVGIENHADDLRLQQAQKNLEVIALVTEQPGVDHFGLVDVFVIVVVLHQRQDFFDGCVGNKGGANPVMDEAVWHLDRSIPDPELRSNVTLAQLMRPFGVRVGPKKRTAAAQRWLHGRFRFANVVVESLQRSRLQLHYISGLCHKN